jgi:hypothetical protein
MLQQSWKALGKSRWPRRWPMQKLRLRPMMPWAPQFLRSPTMPPLTPRCCCPLLP